MSYGRRMIEERDQNWIEGVASGTTQLRRFLRKSPLFGQDAGGSMDYFANLAPTDKAILLRLLCDDVMESEVVRTELQARVGIVEKHEGEEQEEEQEEEGARSRQRKKPRYVKKYEVGELVEVISDDEGLRGAWFSGTIINSNSQRCRVRYDNLIDDEDEDGEDEPLLENLPHSAQAHRFLFEPTGALPPQFEPSTASGARDLKRMLRLLRHKADPPRLQGAEVVGFDPKTGKHTLLLDDEKKLRVVLNDEVFCWMDIPALKGEGVKPVEVSGMLHERVDLGQNLRLRPKRPSHFVQVDPKDAAGTTTWSGPTLASAPTTGRSTARCAHRCPSASSTTGRARTTPTSTTTSSRS